MKKIKSILLFLGLVFIGFASCQKRPTDESVVACNNLGWTDSSAQHPKNIALTKLITNLTELGLPGINLMLEDSNGIWYKSSGYADIKNNTKMSPCHMVKIASLTKLFTATLIYDLVDEGRLNLDDLASKYIDKRHVDNIENLDKSRVRDLLAHSTGIYDMVFDAEFILYTFNNLDKIKSYDQLLEFAHGKKAAFAYNSKQEYNQTLNHTLLAMIVNKIYGDDQSEKLRREILDPLLMTNTYMRPQDDVPWSQVAKGYFDYRKEGVLQDLTPLVSGDGRGFSGIYSNVNDLRLFTNALFKDKTILSPAMYVEMTSVKSANPDLCCAGGCRVRQTIVNGKQYTWFGHPGGEVNYGAGAFYCPQLKATLTFTLNYGVAFEDIGAYTSAYYSFREKLFEEVCK